MKPQLPPHLLPDALPGASARPPCPLPLLLPTSCTSSSCAPPVLSRAHEYLPSATNPAGAPCYRPISTPAHHPPPRLQSPQRRPQKAPPAVQRAVPACPSSPTCAPRSCTSTAAATRRQTRPRVPCREAPPAVSTMSRPSSTTRSVITATGRGTNPSHGPPRVTRV